MKKQDEADLLFGDGRVSTAEAEFLFAMQAADLTLEEKLRRQKEFRVADKDGKWAMLGELCGLVKEEHTAETRRSLGL